jgi:5-methylcytosine-specific restriction endonuclease McrA
MKKCVLCMMHKKNEEFYKAKGSEDGLNRYCKQCCKVNRSLESVRKRDKRSKMSYRQRHRAGVLGVECDTSITLAGVFRAGFGHCGICKKWVQPRHASMDHVHPLSKGGTHTWDNIQLTHLVCNLRKGDR